VYTDHLHRQHRLEGALGLYLLEHMDGGLQVFSGGAGLPCGHCSGLRNENASCLSVGNSACMLRLEQKCRLASGPFCSCKSAVCRRGVLGLGAAFFCCFDMLSVSPVAQGRWTWKCSNGRTCGECIE
jgi:hypothetical protein